MRATIFKRRTPAIEATSTAGSTGRFQSACYAPHSALYLRPDGSVLACCATGYDLGRVTGARRQSLGQIWAGAALARQRTNLEAGRYDYGCQECEHAVASGGRRAALAYHFDRFADGAPHRFPKMMDLALSSRCNLQCVMCNGSLSSSIRTKREGLPPLAGAYDDRFFDELDEFLPHLERLHFKGGEPFLARENRRVWDRLIEQRLTPEVTVTTNATIFNDNVARYVEELRIHPNVSVDGMQHETLESIRVGVVARTLWSNVDRFQALSEIAGNGMTLSFCLMPVNWREVLPFLQEADRRELNPNVIFVNQPAGFDLLGLSHAELDPIFREMAGLPTAFTTPEPQRAWLEILERLQSALERPVQLRVRTPGSPPARREVGPDSSQEAEVGLDSSQETDLRTGLSEAHGVAPLVVDISDGIVRGVDVPDWAIWLGAAGWVGKPSHALLSAIEAEVGPVDTTSMAPDAVGVDVLALVVDHEGRRRNLRVHSFVAATTGQQRCLVIDTGARVDPVAR